MDFFRAALGISEGDTHFCGTQYSWMCLDGTQYAKGRYAVRKHPVTSHAVIYFYL